MFRLTNLFDLTGRSALVTGGSSCIGLEMVRALGLMSASITLVARRETELSTAAACAGQIVVRLGEGYVAVSKSRRDGFVAAI